MHVNVRSGRGEMNIEAGERAGKGEYESGIGGLSDAGTVVLSEFAWGRR